MPLPKESEPTTNKRPRRANTINKNLPVPIAEFPAEMTIGEMRKITGAFSEEAIRKVAKKMATTNGSIITQSGLIWQNPLFAHRHS
jgi:hypothetical protein